MKYKSKFSLKYSCPIIIVDRRKLYTNLSEKKTCLSAISTNLSENLTVNHEIT